MKHVGTAAPGCPSERSSEAPAARQNWMRAIPGRAQVHSGRINPARVERTLLSAAF